MALLLPHQVATRRPTAGLALSALLALACVGSAAYPLAAQSVVRGDLEGTVRAADGSPLGDVSITVTGTSIGSVLETETERDGIYRAPFLPSGEYEVLVEALGFLPRLIRGVYVPPGGVLRLGVELEAATPPVQSVDTVFSAVGRPLRYDGEAGRHISRWEVAGFPDRRMGIGGLVGMSPLLDETLGSEGLPGSLTRVVIDGLPFTPASHPLQGGGSGDLPLLPRIALDGLHVHRGTDVEWSGAAGSYASVTSRTGHREPSGELFAAGTAAPLWQSAPFSGLAEPGMLSGWAGGAAHVPLVDGTSHLFVGVEGMHLRTPRTSPVSESLAARLMDARPPGDGIEASDLSDPWLDDLRAVSGLTRLDWRAARGTEVTARVSFATLNDGGGRFFAPTLGYPSAAPVDGTDVSGAVALLTEVHPQVLLEVRAGFERSSREWGGVDGIGGEPGLPTTHFTDAGVLLGPDPGLAGEVSRTAFLGGPTAHVRLDEHRLKAGFSVSAPSYRYRHVHGSEGEFLFGTPERMATGEGIFLRSVGSVPERTFTVPELGLFLQHDWEPVPGIHLTTGIRYDRESLPVDRVPSNPRWAELTGIRNDDLPSSLEKISPRVGVSWDLTGGGTTLVRAALGTHHHTLDPGALNEVQTLSGSVRQLRRVGGLADWPGRPDAPPGSAEPGVVLALFGPELEAPETARATMGLSQRLGRGSALHLTGSLRRTRFLLRRSDLNLSLQPSGVSAGGRPLHGTPVKLGSVVTVAPGSNRRFPEFDHVWALNTDGWSEQRGVTLAFEHRALEEWEVFAGYTFSVTEDNLVGAASGIPEGRLRPETGESDVASWDEGTSDFDVPHRLAVGFRARLPFLAGSQASAIYRYRSGRPFTPGYRPGVDVTGDGSGRNDPAYVVDVGSDALTCLGPDLGRIARRNGCRGPGVHSLDLHMSLVVLRYGGTEAAVTLGFFNLLDAELGLPDPALLLVDDGAPLQWDPGTGELGVPVRPNPGFGEVHHPVRPGRMMRIGLQVALP